MEYCDRESIDALSDFRVNLLLRGFIFYNVIVKSYKFYVVGTFRRGIVSLKGKGVYRNASIDGICGYLQAIGHRESIFKEYFIVLSWVVYGRRTLYSQFGI